ncbi:MAG TPA: hypothetical protein VF755_00975 [Catenuloplanes sp.]|jgi:hypothetical protein
MTMPTRLERFRAARAARFAATRAMPITACPYRIDGDARQRVLVLVFVREYLRHRPADPGDTAI